jgi:hypothetical protein
VSFIFLIDCTFSPGSMKREREKKACVSSRHVLSRLTHPPTTTIFFRISSALLHSTRFAGSFATMFPLPLQLKLVLRRLIKHPQHSDIFFKKN